MESLDQFRRLEVCEKVNVFVMSLRLSDHKVLHNIASVLIKFFRFRSDLLAFFARISYFLHFWSLSNLIKQVFHSRLLNMRVVIANSALRTSLTIYNLISNARSWNNYILFDGLTYNTRGYFASCVVFWGRVSVKSAYFY